MNKRIVWIFCFLFIGSLTTFAQGGQRRTVEERVKMTMDTLKVNLKLEEAQKAALKGGRRATDGKP